MSAARRTTSSGWTTRRSPRCHCEFRRSGTQWVLRDLGSFNGSFVNNLLVTEHALCSGDRVQLGATVLYFVNDEREYRAAPKPIPAKTAPATGVDAHLATSRKLRNFAALIEITKAFNSELEKPKILETIVDEGIELIKAERGFLILRRMGGSNSRWRAIATRRRSRTRRS